MSTASIHCASLLAPLVAPLHDLLRRLMGPVTPPTRPARVPSQPRLAGARGHGAKVVSATMPAHCVQTSPAQGRVSGLRPLRVVRIVEAGQSSAQVGRMVISGRMADVCAELDRLAAREAALH